MADNKSITQDRNMKGDDDGQEDLLAGFDVLESEKEFLLSLLETAPPEEVKALKGMANTYSTPEVEFTIIPAPRSTVEEFAQTHPCWGGGKLLSPDESRSWVEIEMREFKQDIYKYARAVGMGRNQAKVEIMRAVAAWRKENGLGGGEVLDEWNEESEVETEIYDKSPSLLLKLATPLACSGAMTTKTSKKRKWESLEEAESQNISSQVVEADLVEAKRQRKALKKEKRKAARKMRKEESRGQKAVVEADRQNGDQSRAIPPLPKFTSTGRKPFDESAKKRKKAERGPTTSAYFSNSQNLTTKSKHEPPKLDDGERSSETGRRARKRQKAAARVGAESISVSSITAPLKVEKPTHETERVVEDVAMNIEPPSIEPLSEVQQTEPAQTNLDEAQNCGEYAAEGNPKTHKRKRKRNHNRLPEEQAGGVKIQNLKVSFMLPETAKLYAEKRSRTRAFAEHLPDAHDGDEAENVFELRGHDGADIENEPKCKRNRRKRHPEAEPVVLDESHEPLLNVHDSEILKDDNDAEPEKQRVDPEATQEHEGVQTSPNQRRRDRGRKSKVKQRKDLEPKNLEKQNIVEPLSELANTNTKSPKEARRERERGRRRASDEHSEMDVDAQSSREQSKVRHS